MAKPIRSATLTREGRHWYVSFLVDDGDETRRHMPRPTPRWAWTGVWWWRWPPATASCSTGHSSPQVSGAARCRCNASCPGRRRARPTATRPEQPWPSCGHVSAPPPGLLRANRPPAGARQRSWWCWRDLPTKNMTRRAQARPGPEQSRPVSAQRGCGQVGPEQGHLVERLVSVRAGIEVCVPLHRDDRW